MRIAYISALESLELKANSIVHTVPGKATLCFSEETTDTDTRVFSNTLFDENCTYKEVKCRQEGEIVFLSNGEKTTYAIKPLVRELSPEYSSDYDKFQQDYINLSLSTHPNSIEEIKNGHLKMYAVEQMTIVRDCTEIFALLAEAFPAFRAVCERPKSHLKSVNEVRPIDTVKRIGYESIPYLAAHSEDWLAKTASGLKPARLFSRVEDDEFHIYENLVTKTLIDLIILFLRKMVKEYSDKYGQLYEIMNSTVQTDCFGFDVIFQKAVSEFLSSKEDDNEGRSKSLELVEKMHKAAVGLLKQYRELRKSRLYRYLKKAKQVSNPIKETNILLMNKHYNVIFKLWKAIHREIAPKEETIERTVDAELARDGYRSFCKVLCEYAAHVLGFEKYDEGDYQRAADKIQVIFEDIDDFLHITVRDCSKRSLELSDIIQSPISVGSSWGKFSCEENKLLWEPEISPDEIDSFASLFKTRQSRGKEQAEEKKRYNNLKKALLQRQSEYPPVVKTELILLPIFVKLENENRNAFKARVDSRVNWLLKKHHASQLIIALPMCEEDEQSITTYAKNLGEKVLYLPLSLYDINSFRRLQNVFLRAITLLGKNTCPCCGGRMREYDENQLVCDACNQLILTRTTCSNPDCRHEFRYISYDTPADTVKKMAAIDKENFYQYDSVFQYKDIVHMVVENGKIRAVCPHCHQS